MKNLLLLFIASIFILTGCDIKEKKFEVPTLNGRVVDISKTLSKKDISKIEQAILNFEKTTGGQFAVCIVPQIFNESVESASIKVAEKWKIGHKNKDNGIIFFLTMKEREFRIEVGYGYEGKINDAKAGDLGRLAIPYFKKKKWCDGIITIINGSSNIISGKSIVIDKEKEEVPLSKTILAVSFILVIVILFLYNVYDIDDFSSGGRRGSFGGGGGSFGGGSFGGGGGSFGGGGFSGKF